VQVSKVRHYLFKVALIVSGFLVLSKCQNDIELSANAVFLIEQGNASLQNGSLVNVLTIADSIDVVQPGRVESAFLRGRAFFEMGMLAQAESSFVLVSKRKPDFPGLNHNLGNVYYFKKEYRRALSSFMKEASIAADPRTWHAISGVYSELGNLDSALVAISNSLKLDASYGPALVSSADYKSQKGEFDGALLDMRSALTRMAPSPSLVLKLAKLENSAGDPKTAVSLLKPLMLQEPWNYSVKFELGQALRRVGEEKNAQALFLAADQARRDAQPIELLERIVSSRPADFEQRILLADAYRDQQRFSDALPHYHAAIRLRPNNLDLLANVATIYLQSGNEQEAIARFRSILMTDPNHLNSLLNLAVYFIGKNDREKGNLLLNRAERVSPGHPSLGRIRALL
jgi:tetratricopeptide (TPR) repeat protein